MKASINPLTVNDSCMIMSIVSRLRVTYRPRQNHILQSKGAWHRLQKRNSSSLFVKDSNIRFVQRSASDEYDGWCATPLVSIDNTSNPDYTILNLEILDYPGLMRVIAWCLNGMDVVAEYATMKTSEENVAIDSYWIRTVSGKKLSSVKAEALVERLTDFLTYCSPTPEDEIQTDFIAEPITVSNSKHPLYTVVSVEESLRTPGQMLSIASILSGLNARVMEGTIEGNNVPAGFTTAATAQGYKGTGRLFTFSICTAEGKKFDVNSCKSILYALGIGLGLTSQRFPISPPNRDFH